MFKFSIRKKKEPVNKIDHERIVNTIVNKSIYLQDRWAVFMQHVFEKLSNRSKKFAFILFCLLAFWFSIYVIIESLRGPMNKSVSVTSFQLPKHITQTSEGKTRSPVILSESDYRKIVRIRFYMDSLLKSQKGKMTSDSIIRSRPGLMDSILQLEKLYHLQLINTK